MSTSDEDDAILASILRLYVHKSLYQHSASFKYGVDTLIKHTIPIFLEGLAYVAEREDNRLRRLEDTMRRALNE